MHKILGVLKSGTQSRRTAIAGVLLAIASICTGTAYTIDASPETKADWNLVALTIITAITAVSAWLSKQDDDPPDPQPDPDHRSDGAKPL